MFSIIKHIVEPFKYLRSADFKLRYMRWKWRKASSNAILRYMVKKMYAVNAPYLEREVFGMKFSSPIGLAAGFDRNGDMIESMAAAAQSVHQYFGNGEKILYINVMNNLSIDCDCNACPPDPEMNDIGILSSLDPVALDQACVDLVFNHHDHEGDSAEALRERITSRHGIHTVEHAEKIGLGSRDYEIIKL